MLFEIFPLVMIYIYFKKYAKYISLNITHRTFSQGKAHYYMFPHYEYYPWAEKRSNKQVEMFYNA